ncbi:hypothetical protein [Staphylococcus pettenkoferi]|nr:hypothetical protein [Staphylococcus pettenkoferi]
MNEENYFKAETCIEFLDEMDKDVMDEQQAEMYRKAYRALFNLSASLRG